MKRRAFVAGAAALASLPFIRLKQPKAQVFTRSGSTPGPIPPNPAYVTVSRGTSQAVIQVLKPTLEAEFSTYIIGGGPAYPSTGLPGYDYWVNGAPLPWTGGISSGTQADIINRKIINATNSQYHILFQVTPDQASGEIVTYINVGALGDTFTPITLADAHALAPQLFV